MALIEMEDIRVAEETQGVEKTTVVSALTTVTVIEPPDDQLVLEVKAFRDDCQRRYKFNNSWDTVLTVIGMLLSIAVVGAGFWKRPEISAVLGAIVAAVITAQKAFPFGQRASFYRLLIGQTENLVTRASQRLLNKKEVVDTLSSLRMDFAQQLPRGSNSESKDSGPRPLLDKPAAR